MKYSWLLFDADGTLFDFEKAERGALERTIDRAGSRFEPRHAEVYARINYQLWSDFEEGQITADRLKIRRFELLSEELASQKVDLAANPEQLSAWYLSFLAENGDLIDGAVEVVEHLAEKSRLMLITNGLKDVQRPRVAKSALRDHFADLVISEEVGSAKPDSGIFDEAFRRMGRPAKGEVLIIGDSLSSDIRGGMRYGIDTCWFNPNGRQAPPELSGRFEIARLEELVTLLQTS